MQIDSSVFDLFSADDPAQPRERVLSADGQSRFKKYIPFESFANVIHDYPYPYVIGGLCWEFPCVVPSDWESFYIQGKANPQLLEDWKAALDATVAKQGVMDVVFHPYGWSSLAQHVALIDYAQSRYGKRVKFLSFREALDRLVKNALGGQPIRAADGKDNGVRLIDLNHDGYLDVVIGNDAVRQTRIWSPQKNQWIVSDFPTRVVDDKHRDAGVRFGIISSDGFPSAIDRNESTGGAWHFNGEQWIADPELLNGLELDGPILTADHGRDRGVRFHDLDRDGCCELLVGNDKQNAVFRWDDSQKRWMKLPFALPAGAAFVDSQGRDAGLRLIDIDGDGFDDALFSNDDHYSLHLFASMKDGWSRQVRAGKHGEANDIPPLVHNGTNNGGWFFDRTLWVQNEDTATLPDLVDRRSFAQLLEGNFVTAHLHEASLHNIELRPGFKAELAASEPVVESPITINWGADGRCWVVEMGDYPLGVDGKGAPGGRIRILEDTNGDGRYTKSTIFLDHLPFPTGVLPWGKGVLITDAPNILYAEDTHHDGHADLVKVLFSGFVEGNQQHRVNGLTYGLDNWVYGANGHSGGHVTSSKTGQTIDISGRDFRIKPDEGIIETTTGITQFGHCMNDWGDWFGCDNSNPSFQFVLDEHYLRRNPHFAPPPPRVQVSDQPGAAPVYPISPDLPRFNDFWALHHFTSACAVTIYRDDLFGPNFYGNTFVSEPVGNLVHRELMRRDGVLFHSTRAPDEQKSEFLASFDGWFRPTTLRTGPDGALWVVDMYRQVIEHPQWIPKEWQEKLDLRAGHELGRIYRVYPVGAQPRTIPRLDQLNVTDLVAGLDGSSGWQRDTIQQLIVQRHQTDAIPLLEKMAATSPRDLARLHALCTLDGLGALTPDILLKALADPSPGIVRHAVRLSEPLLNKSPELGAKIIELTDHPDLQVRMQIAYSLGEWDDARAGQALGHLAAANRDQPYIIAAAMTSLTEKNFPAVLDAYLGGSGQSSPDTQTLANLLRFGQAVGKTDAVEKVIDKLAQSADGNYTSSQLATVAALLEAMESAEVKSAAIDSMVQAAGKIARQSSSGDDLKAAAIRLLGARNPQPDEIQLFVTFLTPKSAANVQAAAIKALGRSHDLSVPRDLLAGWKTYTPSLRAQALDTILARPQWAAALLDQIEQKQLPAIDIDPIHRAQLLKTKDSSLRARASKIFAALIKPDRQKVVDDYQPALKLNGDAARGAQVFARTCVACHHFGGVGNAVGPDLASIGDKSPPTLLVSILDPNRAVEPQYYAYVIDTNDGQSLTGVVGSETATSITLFQPSIPPMQILRSDIKSIRATGLSLMPEGLESGLSQQDVADLIAHIRSPAGKELLLPARGE